MKMLRFNAQVKFLKSAVTLATVYFHADLFHLKQSHRISLFCFENSMKTLIHKQRLFVVLHSWNLPNSQVILSGVVLAPAFQAAKHAVKLDQEPAWRLVLISHAAHIDISTGLSTVTEKAEGKQLTKATFFYTARKLQRDFGQVKCSTFPPSKVAQWEPGGLPECLCARECVCLNKRAQGVCLAKRQAQQMHVGFHQGCRHWPHFHPNVNTRQSVWSKTNKLHVLGEFSVMMALWWMKPQYNTHTARKLQNHMLV